jgi:hypothetical protein
MNYDQFILTINSREIGVFMIEIQEAESKSIPKRVEVYLEKLLDAQAVRSFLSFFFISMAHEKHEIHNTGWQGLLSYSQYPKNGFNFVARVRDDKSKVLFLTLSLFSFPCAWYS